MRKIISLILAFLLIASSCWAGIDLDGTDDMITTPSAAVNLNLGTFYLRLKLDYDTTSEITRVFTDTDTARHAFYYSGSPTGSGENGIQMYNDGRVSNFLSPSSWTIGQSVVFIFIYNKIGNVQRLFINGVEETVDTTEGTWGSTGLGTNFYIGSRFSQTDTYDGVVQEVATWSVALTQSEIDLLVNSKLRHILLQIQPANLKGYWSMDDQETGTSADADTVRDLSGNGNNGTGDNGANNTGLTWVGETILSYPSGIISGL